MERAALGLKELVPELDVLAASPYKRAIETAEIIAAAYGGLSVERVPDLAPGAGGDRVVSWLPDRHARGSGAGVGHGPGLRQPVGAPPPSAHGPVLRLRKGR